MDFEFQFLRMVMMDFLSNMEDHQMIEKTELLEILKQNMNEIDEKKITENFNQILASENDKQFFRTIIFTDENYKDTIYIQYQTFFQIHGLRCFY